MCTNSHMLFQLPTELRAMIFERTWDDVARDEGRRAMLAPVLSELRDKYDVDHPDPAYDNETGMMLFMHLAAHPVRDPTTPGNTDMLTTMECAWSTIPWESCAGRQNPRDWWYDYDGRDETYPTEQHADLWDSLLEARDNMPRVIYNEWLAFIDKIHTDYRLAFVPDEHKTRTYERLTFLFENWQHM